MKDKILPIIIGMLVGAIIATAGFLIYNKTIANNSAQPEEMMQMNGEEQMEMPSGSMGQPSGDMEQPPEKPDGDNSMQAPTKPEDLNNDTNS